MKTDVLIKAMRKARKGNPVDVLDEQVELEKHIDGAVFTIVPRIRRVTGGAPRRKVTFGKVEQFQLALA